MLWRKLLTNICPNGIVSDCAGWVLWLLQEQIIRRGVTKARCETKGSALDDFEFFKKRILHDWDNHRTVFN